MPGDVRIVDRDERYGGGFGQLKPKWPGRSFRPDPAIALQESAGFRHETLPEALNDAREDIDRVFRGDRPK